MKNGNNNSVIITLIIVCGILLLGLMGFMFANSTIYAKTVSSTGTATIEVVPDLIMVYFNIQSTGETGSDADDKNSDIYDKMKSEILSLGFDEDEIQTESYSVYPEYDWQSGTQKLKDYIAVHSVKIKISVDKKDKIDEVISAGIDAGAGIGYINYELTDENQNKYKIDAIKLATEDARKKAEALAIGSGSKLGSLVSVSTSDFGYVSWLAYSAEAGSVTKADAVQIETRITPSKQEISSQVTAVFKIK